MIINPYLFAVVTPPGGGGTGTTWNPLDKNANITLSNGNLTATGAIGGSWRAVRGIASASTGIKYYELVDWADSSHSGVFIVGIGKVGATLNSYLGSDANGWGWQFSNASGNPRWNNNSQTTYGALASTGDVIGVLLNLTTGTLVFYKNGVSQGTAFSSLSGTFFPMVSLFGPVAATARFASTSWSNTPAGATEW